MGTRELQVRTTLSTWTHNINNRINFICIILAKVPNKTSSKFKVRCITCLATTKRRLATLEVRILQHHQEHWVSTNSMDLPTGFKIKDKAMNVWVQGHRPSCRSYRNRTQCETKTRRLQHSHYISNNSSMELQQGPSIKEAYFKAWYNVDIQAQKTDSTRTRVSLDPLSIATTFTTEKFQPILKATHSIYYRMDKTNW